MQDGSRLRATAVVPAGPAARTAPRRGTASFRVALGVASSIAAGVALAWPGVVAADCNGPACEPDVGGVEGLDAFLLVAILVLFATVMALGEARRR